MSIVRIVGPGRAGASLAGALSSIGWTIAPPVRHGESCADAAQGVDLCVIATPDAAIEATARQITRVPTAVVAHLAGSLGLEVLATHPRRAAMHPLASLPDGETGAATLRAGVWWAVEGDSMAARLVAELGGHLIPLDDGQRGAYHAAACVAANHLVAIMAQVERITAHAGLPVEPFYALAATALGNAARTGAAAALTGPASRGDLATLARHRAALDPQELPLYDALVMACREVHPVSRPEGVPACR